MCFLSQGVDSFHIGLQKVVLVLDPAFNQVLELLHFYLYDYFVHVRVAGAHVVETAGQSSSEGRTGIR